MIRRGATRFWLTGIAVAGLAGCAATVCPPRHAVVHEDSMSCSEANGLAVEAFRRLGYSIVDFDPATAEQAGKLSAERTTDYDNKLTATAAISCHGQGVEVDAVSNEGCAGQLAFPNDFRQSFAAVQVKKAERQAIAATGPAAGLRVDIEPQRGVSSDLGVDLAPVGLMAVAVTIRNGTARGYTINPAEIVLTAQGGERVKPVPADVAAQRLEQAGGAQAGEAGKALRAHALGSVAIEPQATVRGYVFVPRQAYRKARVVLTDRETEESEGLAVEF